SAVRTIRRSAHERHGRLMAHHAITSPSGETRRPVVVAMLGCMQILAWGSTFYLLPVLARPIVEDTGWAYDRVMAGLALGLLAAGIVSPRTGRLIRRHGGGRRPARAAARRGVRRGLRGSGSG